MVRVGSMPSAGVAHAPLCAVVPALLCQRFRSGCPRFLYFRAISIHPPFICMTATAGMCHCWGCDRSFRRRRTARK